MHINDNFSEVYERNVDSVYRICLMHLGEVHDAEDATQSVFLKYLKRKQTFSDTAHEKAWFIVTSRNYCRDILKSWWRVNRSDIEDIVDNSGYSDDDDSILSFPR